MKKIIILFLLIIVLLTGCIFFQKKEKKNYSTIKFASWGSQTEVSIIKKIIKDFETENKNIKVEFLHIPQNYFQKIHLLFASNMAPDVIFINNQNIDVYTKADLLENLNEYFPDSHNFFHEVALNCFKRNNNLYAIPRDLSGLVLYYNKDIFEKNGKKLPDKINNIYELRDLLIAVTTKDNFGINYEEDPLYWLYYLTSNGGGIISDNGESLILKKKDTVEALTLYSELINKYHVAPTKAEIGSMTTAQMFINQKIAMYLGGRWMFPKFNETIKFNWDIIEFPSTTENKVYIDSSGWAVSKNSKNKDVAIKFVKFLSSNKTGKEFLKSGLIVPARIDLKNEFIQKDSKNKIFIDMLENTKPTPVNYNYRKINDILKEKSKAIFSGEKIINAAFDEETTKKLESLLK